MALSKIEAPALDVGQIGGRRNLIINGAMQVAQRGTVTGITSSSYGGPDRHQLAIGGAGTWTMSQSSTAPTGFASSLKLDCTASTGSPTIVSLFHRIEAQNLQHIKKGTADAEALTLSFWIRSNKTGNIQVNFSDSHNDRMISSVITISSANTFEYKTITIAGDTTGALNNDNTTGIIIEWFLDGSSTYTSGATPSAWEAKSNSDRGVGSTIALADSTANELYITGVQLEVGSVATPFEHRSFGEELALCQRYYWRAGWPSAHDGQPNIGIGFYLNSARVDLALDLPVTMRTTPSIVANSGTNYWNAYMNGDDLFNSWSGVNAPTNNAFIIYTTSGVSGSAGNACLVGEKDNATSLAADAEL